MKFANWFGLFSMSLIGVASYLFIAFAANSEPLDKPTENRCESHWLDLVSSIEELISPDAQRERAIMFAGQDGRIFNCLNQDLVDGIVQELQFWEMARSRSIASDPSYGESKSPNFCNSSYGSAQGMQIMLIHLPYDAEKFVSHACTVRLRGVLDRVKQFL